MLTTIQGNGIAIEKATPEELRQLRNLLDKRLLELEGQEIITGEELIVIGRLEMKASD